MATKPKRASRASTHITEPTQQNALDFMYQVIVQGHLDLGNEWKGWRLRGPYLISPAGDRILPQRLLGMLYVETLQKRTYKALKTTAVSPIAPAPALPVPLRRVS